MLLLTRKIYPVAWLLVLYVTSAQADSVSVARRSIEAAYKAEDAAISRKDSKTVSSFYASGYQLIRLDGKKLGRSEVKHNVDSWMSATKWIKSKATIKKFSLSKGKAIVLVAFRGDAVILNLQTQKSVKVVTHTTVDETWVNIKGKWLKQRAKTLSFKQYFDGKLYKPSR
jgi:ketosteroid isomerase-like protein